MTVVVGLSFGGNKLVVVDDPIDKCLFKGAGESEGKFDWIEGKWGCEGDFDFSLYNIIHQSLLPGGQLKLHGLNVDQNFAFMSLTRCGFVEIVMEETSNEVTTITARKPKWTIGEKQQITDSKPVMWTINQDSDEDDIELEDENDLLLPQDIAPPEKQNPSGGCGTRKACKNCTCGRANLPKESTVQTKDAKPKSSCGNCYRGDAFRCASCPYLGMPAFKPGEQVTLDLTDDL